MNRAPIVRTLAALALLLSLGAHAADTVRGGEHVLAHDLLAQMIGTDTTSEHGSTTGLAEQLARRFLEAGFPKADVQVVGDDPKRRNLVVRLRGRGERQPILLLAHLDVVEARREDWHVDPFKLTARDGYYYGRGTMDIKGAGAGLIATLLRFHQEGLKPKGDYILALTAGEEDGVSNGVQWLLAHRPELIRSEFSINVDGGGPEIRNGRPEVVAVETAEKIYASYTLTVHNPGGHSSLPTPDNAIYRLANGLVRLSALKFPLHTNATTRGYYARLATLYTGALAADMRAVAHDPSDPAAVKRLAATTPYNDAHLRTTCVPTLLAGGDAENALPQMARATVNCRIMPDEQPGHIEAMIKQALADPQIEVAPVAPAPTSPPSPINQALFAHIGEAAMATWGQRMPVSPYMSAGASDSVFLRAAGIPSYVFNGIAYDVNDDRSHGQDERILINSYYQSLEFNYKLLKDL
ncbi:M20/M25/M40 family metallo-hydrolase [Rhodanobacter ginsengisoli]|uniref:M20/M25/M40 family metallo-hydrolase n=1 Tax=Rhodanobacter ginsengisoli TaxID=418646 RepID=A0ABW0QGS4_9GAMM